MNYSQDTSRLNISNLDRHRVFNEDYMHLAWREKRSYILKKDQYTCRKCGITNPSLGDIIGIETINVDPYFNGVKIITEHDVIVIQNYNCGSGEYNIIVGDLNVTISFGIHKIVMPVLQVHHKKYIQNRMLWEYDDNDLLTLCESCHREEHRVNKIPIYDTYNVNIMSYTDTIYTDLTDCELIYEFRNFTPWTFVHKDIAGKYIYSVEINNISLKVVADSNNIDKYIKEETVLKIYNKFMNSHFSHIKN